MIIEFTDGWDDDSLKYLQPLADDVYRYFSEIVGAELDASISLVNEPDGECPLAYFDRDENGCFRVRLTVDSQGLWCKFIYQFSHELCHLFSNHSCSQGHKHKWLEESFCEAASITVLGKLAEEWKKSDIYKYNPSYDDSIWEYRENLISKIKLFGTEQEFTKWLYNNISTLEASSTQRDLNSVVAYNLLKHCLDKGPKNWNSITRLNKWCCHKDATFDQFLKNWNAVPAEESLEAAAVFRILAFID